MLGAVGLFLASTIRQLENFAGVMNFVNLSGVFSCRRRFIHCGAWRNPRPFCAISARGIRFSHAVELIRFALYLRLNTEALGWVALTFGVFMALALWGFDPARGIMTRKAR